MSSACWRGAQMSTRLSGDERTSRSATLPAMKATSSIRWESRARQTVGDWLIVGGCFGRVGEAGVPAGEVGGEVVVEGTGADLEQQVGAARTPAHLLFLHHPLAHDLVDRRLNEGAGDGLSVPKKPLEGCSSLPTLLARSTADDDGKSGSGGGGRRPLAMTVRRMVMWNQSRRSSELGFKYNGTSRMSSPPSVMKVTAWFIGIPWTFSTSYRGSADSRHANRRIGPLKRLSHDCLDAPRDH